MIRTILQAAFEATLVASYRDFIGRLARKEALPRVELAQQRQRIVGKTPAIEFRAERGRYRSRVLQVVLVTAHGEYNLGTREGYRVKACAELLSQQPQEDERLFIENLAPEVGAAGEGDDTNLPANTQQLRNKLGYLAAHTFVANPMVVYLGQRADIGE